MASKIRLRYISVHDCGMFDKYIENTSVTVWLGQTLAAGRLSKGTLDQFFELTNAKHHDNLVLQYY